MAELQAERSYWKKRVGRRPLLRGAALGGAGLAGAALIGCGSDDDANGSVSTPAPGGGTAVGTPTPSDPDAAVRGGTLVFMEQTDISGFDPTVSHRGPDLSYHYSIYEPLVSTAPDFSTHPGLAESWEVADPVTINFKIRTNSTWHDGAPVTAEDVKFTIERHKDVDVRSYAAGQVTGIESVEVIDDTTVRFNLNAPTASIFAILGERAGLILPQHVVTANADQFNIQPVGSGPYRFQSYQADSSTRLTRYEDYWQEGFPYLDEIRVDIVPTASVRFANVEAGRADLTAVGVTERAQARQSNRIQYFEKEATSFTGLNTNSALWPNTDKRLRQAMTYALNRQAILDGVYLGEGVLANGPISGASWAYAADLPVIPEDLQRSRDLLAAAGYPDGFEFDLITEATETKTPEAEMMKAQWARVGINANLIVRTFAEGGTAYREQQAPAFHTGFSGRADPDQTIFENWHSTGAFNRAKFNPDWEPDEDQLHLDDLMQQAREVYDFEERKVIYAEISRLLVEDAHHFFFTFNVDSAALSLPTRGFQQYGDGRQRLHEMWKEA